jgi:hypothetical protein
MSIDIIPQDVRKRYQIEERRHACAILYQDCRTEFDDLIECLRKFEILKSEIVAGGGGKSRITSRFDISLWGRHWIEKSTKITRLIDDQSVDSKTHKVDFWKGNVAIEMEWNSKDSVFSRDLNVFRLLHEIGVISVGVIVTRCDALQELFDSFGKRIGAKYGQSTTHWGKLIPKVESGGSGDCPLLLVGITAKCYRDDG